MPPRTLLLRPQTVRILPLRPIVHVSRRPIAPIPQIAFPLRPYSSSDRKPSDIPPPPQPTGPNQDVLPHVSEEAAITCKITGETGPELEQGTPISEVLSRDPEAMKKAPSVLKKDIPSGKRGYSTMAMSPEPELPEDVPPPAPDDLASLVGPPPLPEGAKYPLPELPLPEHSHLRKRYSPILEQFTNILMWDGKKAAAQRTMAEVLSILRTRAAPKENPRVPIIPSAPPLASLPRDPLAYLQVAIDSVAPLLRMKSVKGSGGFREHVPIPLSLKQRRRRAITWILDSSSKKAGRMTLPARIADEIVSVLEGKSSVWDKRLLLHKTGTANRANVTVRA